ncbi:MAG: fructose-bisphosphate aldolase [Gammaproteobacteria bacterium]
MTGYIGKQIRLGRMFSNNTGRAICLAFDHGMMLGPIQGFEDPGRIIDYALEAELDGIILTPGMLSKFADRFSSKQAPSVILRLDQTSMWRAPEQLGYQHNHNRLIASVEDAVALGVDAVITYLFVGHLDSTIEAENFEIYASVAAQCRKLGILHVVETMAARNGQADNVFDPRYVAMHTRIGSELGADIIKTDWSGDTDSFSRIVNSTQAPILVAGGASIGNDNEVLQLASDVVSSGAAGILFGRNIVQSSKPLQLMRALRAVVHDNARPEDLNLD